jgi:hypothetical protein
MDEHDLIDLPRQFAELPPQTEEGQTIAEQLAGMAREKSTGRSGMRGW